MNYEHAVSAQRWQLRERLAEQQVLMATLAAAEVQQAATATAEWPRSLTMRLLVRRPLLVTMALRWIAGPRIAGALLAGLALGRLLRARGRP
ncbi:MAG TPA: hypothetical protein VM240_11395 [Verrucomicrobiae bacterium]|nr:hypothetical protein [Verrucomicrobiae bacterium]